MNNQSRNSLAKFSAWASSIALGVMLSAANAGVLVIHEPNGTFGYDSSIDAGVQNADLTFNGSAVIEGISWWGTFVPDDDLDLFTVRIFNGSDLPDAIDFTPIFSIIDSNPISSIPPSRNPDGNLFRFDLDLTSTPVSLASGNYFLSIMNETTSHAPDNWRWWTSTSSSPDRDSLNQYRSADGDPWLNDKGVDFSLVLSGTRNVPEPDTAALLLLAGLGLMLVRRRVG